MVDFGKNLVKLRKLRQLTQAQLADILDIQPRLVGRWEQGQGKPQFDHIVKLADALEVTIDQLLRGDSGITNTTFEIKNRKLKELCKKVDQLSTEDQQVICHFLDMAVRQDHLKQVMGGTFK
jgi:transcriptional regulator with XRE-family HTH domain